MDQAEAVQDDFISEESDVLETDVQEEVEDVNEETEVEESEEPESIYEEVEYEGNKYSLPPELKAALMRQSDYTQKTQEVAEQRKALGEQYARFQQAAQAQQQNLQGYAQLHALQNQLNQYQGVNWNELSESDPTAAQQHFIQYSQLKDAVSNLSRNLEQQQQASLEQQRMLYARQVEQGKAELARDIPGWSAETAKQITDHGASYGFTEQELHSVADPRMVKVLHDAMMYRQSLKKATEHKSTAKPVSKIKGNAKVEKDPNKMSTDEWLKWRNKQLSN